MGKVIAMKLVLKRLDYFLALVPRHSLQRNLMQVCLWILLSLVIFLPTTPLYAQDPEDEEGEMFWGDEEEGEEEYAEDDDEYLDDEEYYEEETDEGDDEESEYEEEYDDEESEYEEEYDDEEYDEETELDDEANPMGWSIDISGSKPRLVNYTLWDQFNLEESIWAPSVDARVSIEAPYLMQMMGMRFRIGVEVGTFGFKDLSEREAELKGITALGLVSFPAGPGKIKIGAGVFGSSVGFMFEATYGMAIGSLDMRIGIRTAEVLGVIDSANRDLGHVGWMDGLVVLGVNI